MSLTHAIKWSFLSELASKLVSPIVFLILARMLTPEDFGVMSAAIMVMGFSQIFWEAGMGKALIQRQTDNKAAANVAFWINVGLGIFMVLLLLITAKFIAQTFFQDGRVTAVIQVMTVQVFLGAITSVHTALLQKEMGFKKLFWVRFASIGLPALASIPLALNGMGYWALVAGALVGQLAQALMLLYLSTWRPDWSFNVSVAKEMSHFSAWVGLTGVMIWFYTWVDALIIGMYLGVHELGIFRTGNMFATMIFGMLFAPITPVLYSHFVLMNQNKARMRKAVQSVIKTLTFISIPIALLIFSLSNQIGIVFLGDKWEGVGYVIGVMVLVHGFAYIVGMNGEIYRAMGRPDYETLMAGTTMLVYIAAYLYSIKFGIEVFLWTRLGLSLLGLTVHLIFLKKLLSMPIFPIVNYIILIFTVSSTIVLLVAYKFGTIFSSSIIQLFIGGSISVFILGGALFIIERNGILKELKALFITKTSEIK